MNWDDGEAQIIELREEANKKRVELYEKAKKEAIKLIEQLEKYQANNPILIRNAFSEMQKYIIEATQIIPLVAPTDLDQHKKRVYFIMEEVKELRSKFTNLENALKNKETILNKVKELHHSLNVMANFQKNCIQAEINNRLQLGGKRGSW